MDEEIIIGIDFSITKPGICIKKEGKYLFAGFPRKDQISEARKKLFEDNGAFIISRTDEKNPHKDSSAKMSFTVQNSQYLANLITDWLKPHLFDNTKIIFEGLSFGSTGDAILQLGGYKYMLMDRLSKYVPLKNMYTYAPITLKKTAGCSKRGMGKNDMIDSFLKEGTDFGNIIKDNEEFKKKGAKNYIELLDDLIDAYFAVRTYEEKELS